MDKDKRWSLRLLVLGENVAVACAIAGAVVVFVGGFLFFSTRMVAAGMLVTTLPIALAAPVMRRQRLARSEQCEPFVLLSLVVAVVEGAALVAVSSGKVLFSDFALLTAVLGLCLVWVAVIGLNVWWPLRKVPAAS